MAGEWTIAGCETLETRVLMARMGLDYSFGDAGLAQVDASVLVASLSGGKVLAVNGAAATRLNADGSVDNTFFDAGGVQASFGKLNWAASSAVVSGDRLYIAGVSRSRQTNATFDSDTVFIRALNLADGSKVDSFGEHGFVEIVITALTAGDAVYSIAAPSIAAIAGGGFVITVGHHSRSAGAVKHEALTLYKSDDRGRLSHTFGGNGEVIVPNGGVATGASVQVDATGRSVVFSAGRFTRFLASGSLDMSFGQHGSASPPAQTFLGEYGRFTLQPDGKAIIPFGVGSDGGDYSIIARQNADGSNDKQLGFDFTFRYGASSPVVDDQGRVLLVQDGAIVRLTPDFAIDATFAEAGRLPIPDAFDRGTLAIADDGSIFMGNADGVTRFALTDPVQLASDGVLHVEGYGGNDDVSAVLDGRFLNVTFNGEVFTYRTARIAAVEVTTRGGNDSVDLAINLPATISTSFGNDTIRVAGHADVSVLSGEGLDFVQTGDGGDTILAGGRATILSGGGNDFIGSQDPERYYNDDRGADGTATYLEVDMGAGDDEIHTGDAECFAWGGEGNDLIDNTRHHESKFNRANGEGGDDTILGGAGADIITGGPGNDSLDGRDGMNRIDGVTVFGPSFRTAYAGYTLDARGLLTFIGSPANDTARIYYDDVRKHFFIESIGRTTAADADVIKRIQFIGGGGDDFLGVNEFVEIPVTIDGGSGNDRIEGGALADVLIGGDGNDRIDGNDGNDSLFGAGGNDSLNGDFGDDYFEGGAGDDILVGGPGADRLFGLGGNDTLISDDGVRDTVRGGTGFDTADADDLDDVLAVEA
jgi:Ca2+-binding RTX toxin-like protein